MKILEREHGITWQRHLLAGGIAGGLSRTATAPLERIKINLQVYVSEVGIISCAKNLYAEGGIRSFWRGNFVNVFKIAPESAMKFSTNEWLKESILGDSKRELTVLERFAAGSVAGGLAQSSVYPLEVLKTRLAVGKSGEFTSVLSAVKQLRQVEGMRIFYRGFVPNLLGIIPYAGFEISVYEWLRHHFQPKGDSKTKPSIWQSVVYGVTAASAGQTTTYPLSLIRTRLITQDVRHGSLANSENTMLKVLIAIVKQDGFIGLYRGFPINLMRVLPAVSLTYVALEILRQMMGITSK